MSVKTLDLEGNETLESLHGLGGLLSAGTLMLNANDRLKNLEGLSGLSALGQEGR